MTHSFTPPLLPLGTFVSQCIPALRASALLLLWLAHVPSGMQKSNRARGPWLRVQGSAQPIAEADRDEADKSMCPGSLWRELPIVPKAGQELPSYISTHTRSGCLRLAISVAGPRAALPPRPRALFFLFASLTPLCDSCREVRSSFQQGVRSTGGCATSSNHSVKTRGLSALSHSIHADALVEAINIGSSYDPLMPPLWLYCMTS